MLFNNSRLSDKIKAQIILEDLRNNNEIPELELVIDALILKSRIELIQPFRQ